MTMNEETRYIGEEGAKFLLNLIKKNESTLKDTVLVTEQNLTDKQKAQARKNLDINNQPSWNDLTDKPFYTDENGNVHKLNNEYLNLDWIPRKQKLTTVFPTQSIGLATNGSHSVEKLFDLIVGKTYIVTWNGAEYKCVAKEVHDDNFTTRYLGNASLDGYLSDLTTSYTDEPFCYEELIAVSGSSTNRIFGNEKEVTITMQIDIVDNTPNKLPVEFLPEGVPYLVGNTIEVFPETSLEFDEEGLALLPLSSPLETGKQHTVVWNGVPYECVCVDGASMNGPEGSFVLGNFGAMDGNSTGEPFLILCESGVVSETLILSVDGTVLSTTATVSIYEGSVTAHKLDPRCLPKGVPYIEDVITELLPKTELSLFEDDGMVMGVLPTTTGLVAGETYVFNYNGVDYNCVATDMSAITGGLPLVALGNLSMYYLPHNNEPFMFMDIPPELVTEMNAGGMFAVMDGSTSTTATISIGEVSSEILHKLDSKLLDLEWLPSINYKKTEIVPLTTFPTINSVMQPEGREDSLYQLDSFKDHVQDILSFWGSEKLEVILDDKAYNVTIDVDGTDGISYRGIAEGYTEINTPFMLLGTNSNTVMYVATEGEHFVSISSIETEYNKIPTKFLPEDFIPKLKTINGQSLVGEGDIVISGDGTAIDLSTYATKEFLEQNYKPKDETVSWDDLEDRPFYSEAGGRVDILPESTPIFMEDNMFAIASKDGVLYGGSIPTADIVAGEQYTVMWNGVEYNVVAQAEEMLMPGVPVLVNEGANLETGEGAVFVIQLSPTGVEDGETLIYGIIVALDGSQSVTLSVYQGGEVIHHLDSKYIKDMYYEKQEECNFVIYSGNLGQENHYSYEFITGGSAPLVLGETYNVVADGVEYPNCPTFEGKAYSQPAVCIEVIDTNGRKYGIASSPALGQFFGLPNAYYLTIYDTSISTDVNEITTSIKVSGIKTVIKEIDQKFLPDTSATVEYVDNTIETVKTELQTNIDGKLSIEEADTGLEGLVLMCGLETESSPIFLGSITSGNQEQWGIYYSEDGINWNISEETRGYTFYNISSIPYHIYQYQANFVAVGKNVIAYSINGIEWTLVTSIPQVSYRSVTYAKKPSGDVVIVAVGDSGTIVYSKDKGVTWTKATTPTTNNLTSICYGDSKLIAISLNNTTALMSEDYGVTWSTIELPVVPKPKNTTRKAKICYGNGTYVYTGDGKYIVYSYDGIEWHTIDFEVSYEDYILEISFLGGKFLLESWHGTLYYSNDDISLNRWKTSIFYGGNSNRDVIAYDLESHTIYGYSKLIKSYIYLVKSTRNTNVIMTPDLENAIKAVFIEDGVPVPLDSFKFLGIDVLKSEQQKAITLSEPAILFNRSMASLYLVEETIRNVVSKGNTTLAITDSEYVYASSDGLEWSKFYDFSGFKDACFGENENIIALRTSGSIYYTEEAKKSWVTFSNGGIALTGDRLLYHNGLYISHVKSYSQESSSIHIISCSTVLEDCNITPKGLSFSHKNMCSNGSRLVALDIEGKLHYSDDNAESWLDCNCTANCSKIFCVNGKFMAIDVEGYIYYSEEGIDWFKAKTPFSVELSSIDHSITYCGDRFIYLGYNNTPTISSNDGVNWFVEKSIPYGSYTNLHFINGTYVVNDSEGNYAYSVDGATWKFNKHLEQNKNDVTQTVLDLVKTEGNLLQKEKGSSLIQVVNLTLDEATGTITSEKSASEIMAMNLTSPVFVFFNGAYAQFTNSDSEGNVSFSTTALMDSQVAITNITVFEDKSCKMKVATLSVEVTEM